MDSIYLSLLLEYLYNKFAVTFILCLIGAFLKQSTLNSSSRKVSKLKISSLLSPAIFSTVLICAISEYLEVSFSVYAVICVLAGMWSSILLKLFLNINIIKKFIAMFLKNIAGPLSKYSEDIVEELDDIDKKEKEGSNESDPSSSQRNDEDNQ